MEHCDVSDGNLFHIRYESPAIYTMRKNGLAFEKIGNHSSKTYRIGRPPTECPDDLIDDIAKLTHPA